MEQNFKQCCATQMSRAVSIIRFDTRMDCRETGFEDPEEFTDGKEDADG